MQDLYTKRYKMMKEIRENLNKQIDQPCSWSGRFNLVKVLIILELLIPIMSSGTFFVDIDKEILKFKWKVKGARISKTVFYKKKRVGGLSLPSLA